MVTSSCCCLMESRKISRRRNQEITKEELPDKIPVRIVHPEEEEESSDPDVNITWDDEEPEEEPAVCSAKEFYASSQRKKGRASCSGEQGRQRGFDIKGFERRSFRFNRQPFVPPLPSSRSFRGLEWEPSLSSVQELSQEI